jgi:hypothetical protein
MPLFVMMLAAKIREMSSGGTQSRVDFADMSGYLEASVRCRGLGRLAG